MMITSRITCITWHCIQIQNNGDWAKTPRIARFMGQPWGPSGADRTQVGPMLAPWTLLSGTCLTLRTKSRHDVNFVVTDGLSGGTGGCRCVSNHQPHDCLLNLLFRRRSKKNIKAPRHWPLCGEFPAQMASYAENVSISWSHHGVVTHHCMFRHYGGNWPCFTCHHIYITPRLHSSV